MSKPAKTTPVLLVKNSDAQKGELWSTTAKNRFIKQHGSVDEIPEDDAHAVPVYDDPTYVPPPSPEETKVALDSLAAKLKQLKDQGKPQLPPQPKGENFYDEWVD